jgi:transposase
MAYSIDYRKAAIEYKQSGHTFAQLKEVFKITACTYYQWLELQKTTGTLKFRNASERRRKIDPDALKLAVEEKPDAYLRELAVKFGVSEVAIHKRLKKLKITYKKRHLHIRKSPRKTGQNISKN